MGDRPTLEYGHATRRLPRRALVAIVAVLALVPLLNVSVGYVEHGIDPVTGTTYRRTVGPFDIALGTRVIVSPLERRLVADGVPFTPSCKYFGATGKTILGRDTFRECGTPPAIASLSTSLNDVVATCDAGEIRAFVAAFQAGDDVARRDAVDTMTERLYPCTLSGDVLDPTR